ncbi:MAG: hypothetical protein R6U98_15635 [Pirellulaceae bacterium]
MNNIHYFWDGDYTLKMFWAKAPIHIAISQDVGGLEVGREYRFVGASLAHFGIPLVLPLCYSRRSNRYNAM